MAAYFFRIRGRVFGPFSEAQAQEMVNKGKVGRTSDISEDRINWSQAGNYENLFPKAASQETSPSQATTQTQATSAGLPGESAEWYYSVDGESGFGPVTKSTIDNLIEMGTLGPENLVWKEGETANKLMNVFPASFFSKESKKKSRSSHSNANSDDVQIQEGDVSDQLLAPCTKSLGSLMFIKIFFLIYLILGGIGVVTQCIFILSSASMINSGVAALLVILYFVIYGLLFVLVTRILLNLWRYHAEIMKTTFTKNVSDFIRANEYLRKFWESIFWLLIAILSLDALGIITFGIFMIVAQDLAKSYMY